MTAVSKLLDGLIDGGKLQAYAPEKKPLKPVWDKRFAPGGHRY